MPRETQGIPTYLKRIVAGKAYGGVILRDAAGRRRTYTLGRYGTADSRERYARLISQWLSMQRELPVGAPQVPAGFGPTVAQLSLAYQQSLAREELSDGYLNSVDQAMGVLVKVSGDVVASRFGPNDLRTVRQAMLDGDENADPPRKGWSRRTTMSRTSRVLAMFRWAASHEYLPVTVYQTLKTVEPLRARHKKDPEPVRPVPVEHVEATVAHVSAQVGAMIKLQLLTGMRPGEVRIMRPCDLDMSGSVWTYRPESHKTAHRGHARCIYLGPKAREIIQPFLAGRATQACLFSPAEAEATRRAELHEKRKTPLSCGNRPGTNRAEQPRSRPGTRYSRESYSQAIERGAQAAGVPHWFPNQLRHTFATEIRKQHGIEAARILLGHRSLGVTEIYAERDDEFGKRIAAELG